MFLMILLFMPSYVMIMFIIKMAPKEDYSILTMTLLASDGILAWTICQLGLAMVSINTLSVDS
jgi:hypothetical protein